MTADDGFDHWYRRLTAASRRLPAVRAVSISRFLIAYPKDRPGASFYLPELAPMLLRALADPSFRLADPDLRAEVQHGLDVLAAHGVVDDAQLRAAQSSLLFEPLASSVREAEGGTSTGAYIPVVQQIVDRDSAAPSYVGVLLRLRVYPSVSEDPGPELRYLCVTEAEETRTSESVVQVARQALRLAKEHAPKPGLVTRLESWIRGSEKARPTFAFNIGDEQVSVSGSSAGLALAMCLLGALTGLRRRGRGFRPSSKLAWTGSIDAESGLIVPVQDGPSLRAKVRAAYFEGFDGIAVPLQQLPSAEAAVPLRSRPFSVHGVERLDDLLVDNAFTILWRMPASIRYLRRREPTPRERLLKAAWSLGTLLVTIAVVNAIYGPRTYIIPGTDRKWILILQDGIRPPLLHHDQSRMYFHRYSSNLAGEPPGARRLVLLREFSTDISSSNPHLTQLEVYSLPALPFAPARRLWWYDFIESGLPAEPLAVDSTAVYGDAGLWVGELDGAFGEEIVTWTPAHPFSRTLVSIWNGEHYPVGAYIHKGANCTGQYSDRDLDDDGKIELISVNHGNTVGGTSVLLMNFEDFCPTDARKLSRHSHGYSKAGSSPIPDLVPSTGPAIAAGRRPVPPPRPFDEAHQPCVSNFIIPVPDSIYAINSTDTFQTRHLNVVRRGSSFLTFDLWALPRERWFDDYIICLRPPNRMAPITINASGAKEAVRLGHPYLASPEFLRSWRQSCRVYDHIYWGEPDSTGRMPEEF